MRRLLVPVVVGGLLYVAGQYVASQPQRVEQEAESMREITVTGRGEVTTRPDVALLTLGVQTGVQPTAETALGILSDRFERVVGAVTAAGVDEDDVTTTNLSITPLYDYRDGRQTLRGFEASESVRVKIRDLSSVGDVLARTTGEGVNQAGGLVFQVDDPAQLQLDAQKLAITDARENAKQLADALGVRLGRVKTFSASGSGGEPPIPFAVAERAAADGSLAGPPVPSGTQDITSTVTVTFMLQ